MLLSPLSASSDTSSKQPMAGIRVVALRHVVAPAGGLLVELRQAGIGFQLLGRGVVIRFEPQVGADALVGAGEAVDLVATEAAVAANRFIAGDQFRRRRIGIFFARLEIDHVVMAFQAAAFDEPLGKHRPGPVFVAEPVVVVASIFVLDQIVRRVRGPFERRFAPLPLMANRAAELIDRMRAQACRDTNPAADGWRRDAARRGGSRSVNGWPQTTVSSRYRRTCSGLRHAGIVDRRDHVAPHQSRRGRQRPGIDGVDRHIAGVDAPARSERETVDRFRAWLLAGFALPDELPAVGALAGVASMNFCRLVGHALDMPARRPSRAAFSSCP